MKHLPINIKQIEPIARYASLLAFVAFTVYILYINQEVLYTAQEHSEFLPGADYLHALMRKPFGLMQYVGAWLTQFFYYPALGSMILVAIWVITFGVGTKAFGLQGGAKALMLLPVACLLTSMVDLGYWVYVMTTRGYWFSQSVGYLVMLLLLWTARCTPRQWHLVWYLLAMAAYPVLGWFALLFVVCLALSDKLTWREGLGLILLLFTANIWRALLYSNTKLQLVMMAGLPQFATPSDETGYLSAPFWILGGISIVMAVVGRYLNKWYVPVLSAVAGIVFTLSLLYQDQNYIDEMRMTHDAEEGKWGEVLETFAEAQKPTTSMVILKNVALMNEGGLLNRSFEMGNSGAPIYNPDSVHVSFLEIAAPVAYYNYGMINEGFRLSFECAVQAGFAPVYLKAFARCALANGELSLMNRYTAMLHGHPFYAHWQPAPVNNNIYELKGAYANELTGVENSETYLINSICQWYESDSKLASEQALFYAMLRCDSKRFWASIRKYVKLHMDEEFPVHAQEAYILFIDKAPEQKRIMIPVSQEIYDRYKRFWSTLEGYAQTGMKQKDIQEKMRKEFGDTYWYYNILGQKIR